MKIFTFAMVEFNFGDVTVAEGIESFQNRESFASPEKKAHSK